VEFRVLGPLEVVALAVGLLESPSSAYEAVMLRDYTL